MERACTKFIKASHKVDHQGTVLMNFQIFIAHERWMLMDELGSIVMKMEMWWTCMQWGDCISTMDEKWMVMDDIMNDIYLKDEQKKPLDLSYWKLSIGQNWLWL